MKSTSAPLFAFATAALLMFPPSVQSQTTAVVTTLYNFVGNGTDGVHPQAGLIQGSDGNFYGTTVSGGGSGYGTVFRISPAGVFTTLHSFTGSGTDGASPKAGLIQGSDGNFYGTTNSGGGSYYCNGTVFQITPGGVLTTLHSFTQIGTDGSEPDAGLVQGSDGNFYGTTYTGSNNFGTVFSITSSGEYTNLHSFSGSGMDGEHPEASLVQGSDGNFYGTTAAGGGSSSDGGTVFQITPAGNYTTLHSFTGIGLDGQFPRAGLIQGSDGNFYGTTASGGAGEGVGTVYQITPTGLYRPLYSFPGTDGATPFAGLVQGSDGNLYGTTEYGGSGSAGTVFQVTLAGAHIILHSFTGSGTDGVYPDAGLIQGSDGNFYGTTPSGGSSGQGTIFKLTFVPVVSLAIAGADVIVAGGAPGILTVTRTGGDTSLPLTVSYKAKGAAQAGVDYKKLPGTVTIPAGAVKAKIKIKPIDGSPNAGTPKIKVQLLPSVDGSYVIGTSPVKLKLMGK